MINQLPESLLDSVRNVIEEETEYQTFFKGALKKFGVTSPKELSGDKEKEFYNYVDANWKGKDEKSVDETSCGSSKRKMKEELDESKNDPLVVVHNKSGNVETHANLSTVAKIHGKDYSAHLNKLRKGQKIKIDGGRTLSLSSHNEEVELDEAKTFKSLEDWMMAVFDAGGTISKSGNTLRANGLGRTQSATWELKKGRGSMLESVEEA